MNRSDLSPCLHHFTRGSNSLEALANLTKIIRDGYLLGTAGFIRGGHKCVCFTEAPVKVLWEEVFSKRDFRRYSPFGIRVNKKRLFESGGRPVIYQPDTEYALLGESIRWRHVRFDLGPSADGAIDFTWEREWRIQTEKLVLNPIHFTAIVPNEEWAGKLYEMIAKEHLDELVSSIIRLGFEEATSAAEEFPWKIDSIEPGFFKDDELEVEEE